MALLSQGELMFYFILRWDDNVIDIREQFPLDSNEVRRISDKTGIPYPVKKGYRMTTDFLVDYNDGHQVAYNIKTNRNNISKHDQRYSSIEELYWNLKGTEYRRVYKDELNPTLADNIRRVFSYYDPNTVTDEITMVKHLIAHKQIIVDMNKPINYSQILNEMI